MNYNPVRCPTCGSAAIVPAENKKFYCKSCDGWFTEGRVAERHAPDATPPISEKSNMDDNIGIITLGFIFAFVAIVMLFLA